MFYHFYEMNRAAMEPLRTGAEFMRSALGNPLNPLSWTPIGRNMEAGLELFERLTRRYDKPSFNITGIPGEGEVVAVEEKIVWSKPFCKLLHFEKRLKEGQSQGPKVLLVAPMSGHHATLLRGTVEALLPFLDIHITDWVDARIVPEQAGRFGLDDYIGYLGEMLHHMGRGVHVIAVCQPSVPVLAAVSIMEEDEDPFAPASMTLMGGPIDTRVNPTAVNEVARNRSIDWFRDNVIMDVPWPHTGHGRAVYPGFLQLGGFMSMNLDRHIEAHHEFYMNLVRNDGDPAEKHREFYDEYMAVMDLDAAFYLDTVDTVFIRHALPQGKMTFRDRSVDPSAIRNVALLTIEGEKDDISGVGQTQAAHDLCTSIPSELRHHHVEPEVGHYGVFNGQRFRSNIAPRIVEFISRHAHDHGES